MAVEGGKAAGRPPAAAAVVWLVGWGRCGGRPTPRRPRAPRRLRVDLDGTVAAQAALLVSLQQRFLNFNLQKLII